MSTEKYLAIDVGGTAIKYAITDKNAEINKINEIKTRRNREELFESLDEIIHPHLNQIAGIAMSFPGKINARKGIVGRVATFKWICDMPLKSILEEKYGKPVWIENDGKCSALAELWKGNLSDVENGMIIGLGTEIAGGIILNGKLYRGSSESAGEISSILTNFKTQDNEKRFGKIGGHKNLTDAYNDKKGTGNIDSYELFEKYKNGDELAYKVIKDYSRTIAAGIITIQSVLDLEKFCIGGGISAQDVLITEIKKSVHEYFEIKSSEAITEPEIERCHFKNASGCVGALYNFLIRENVF
ncbi:ROK family protein [uncultured Methanobrevibacter sp.]|uniref:ROK family protein n=1 Tax=uncultured Methanobrevibacter sp. TaxID=253161 RepID=UPI0025F3EA32|nr:ROK family protein [uncultured Methanobrevibacter sp.]